MTIKVRFPHSRISAPGNTGDTQVCERHESFGMDMPVLPAEEKP